MTASSNPWLVFSDDWGRHPSSCQHLIRQLLPRHNVTWVNTIGTRPPRLDLSTAKRVVQKLRSWTTPKKPATTPTIEPAPVVVSPKMWPSFQSNFGRATNKKLLLKALLPLVEAMPAKPVIMTTLPIVADLVGELPAHRWVYYCVDDFGVWPGYDGATMRKLERELVPKMDVLVAVSETLQAHLKQWNRPSHLLTHGVDLDHWIRTDAEVLPEIEALPKPLVVFWGVVDRRMDTVFLQALSQSLVTGTILLVGPKEDPDPKLHHLKNVVHHSPLAFRQLPALARAASVLVMPYADIPATRAMQPLKLKEYLATGKPAVVRRLPSTEMWADTVDVVDTPEQFANAVLHRLQTGLDETQRTARIRLSTEGWEEKAIQFEQWVVEL
jgi:glycosyltransferase involved in cell wall biosynthesis